jgi:glycosyltransferase involved in cell wall biosynthesis
MYLSEALASIGGIELFAVRIAQGPEDACEAGRFSWPIEDLQLGRLGLSSLYLRQRRRFRDILERVKPDVVHGQESDIAGYLAVGSGYPAVLTVHGILGECAKLQSDPVVRARSILAAYLTERHSIGRANDLIAISSYVTRYYEGTITGQVHYVPNAVADAYFQVERAVRRGRFLYAGRVSNGKGLVELVRAVQRLQWPESELVLAGASPDPAYERHIREQVRLLGLSRRVKFAGLLDEAALRTELSRAEALLLPSHQETAPMVIQEAMAAGVAVIATRVGGIPEQVVDGVTGILFDAGDVEQLTDAMTAFRQDEGAAVRMGFAGKALAEKRYRASAVASATCEVYRRAVARADSNVGPRRRAS